MRLQLSDVSKRFGKLLALDGVSLEVPSGRALALVGPNGSGKSTLIRVVVGLVASEGRVLFDGASRSADTAKRVAYVPQIAPQLAAPVTELVRTVAKVRAIDPAEVAALGSELGLDVERIGRQPFRNLSGGMKQKLLLSLALAAPATLYVLDEPTASLDAESRAQFFRLFERRRGATLILCSHRIEEIRQLVDHVVALQDGRVVYDGAAAPYLSEQGEAIIELRVQGATASAWLLERGFVPGAGGWWGRTVDRNEKLPLLRELTAGLNGQLENIQVRDLERLEGEQRRLDA